MVMQDIREKLEAGLEDDRYACTEVELYHKAIALLEKCRIESRLGQEIPESTTETSSVTARRLRGTRNGRIA